MYDHKKLEKKWQDIWEKIELYKTPDESKLPKYYSLVMFPYPSGDLHIGHWYNFSPADTYSRFMRMQGYNVLNPIGFDAFGLPAENAAIKHGIHPQKWTFDNIDRMTAQLKAMGPSYDWSRTLVTASPEYYRWTQWMFLLMYERGLAYKKKVVANWCPSCNTVLANEQVVNGKCERCGSGVIQKELDQWLFKITDYAERLLSDIDEVDWPEKTKTMQRNWIGKSEGARVKFKVKSEKSKVKKDANALNTQYSIPNTDFIEVYTTRPDTLFGATFMVLAPENPFVAELLNVKSKKEKVKNFDEIEKYVQKTQKKTELERISEDEKEKTGVFTGAYAINPINEEKIPIWISDYVLMNYGTGAIMAVPAHDKRDWDFAKKFDIPIREVIIPKVIDKHDPPRKDAKTIYRKAVQVILVNPEDDKVLVLKWKKFAWTTFITGGVEEGEDAIEAARREVAEETGYEDIEYVRTLGGPVESHFYASHKGVNRKAHFTALVFKLKSKKRKEISEEEKAIHEISWMSWDELGKDKNIKCAEYDIWISRFFEEESHFSDKGVLVSSGKFTDLESDEAKDMIIAWLEEKGLGKRAINYKIRDWLISRQRYWGAPIPIVNCEKCGEVPIPVADLPVLLPDEKNVLPTGESPLVHDKEFLYTKCPKCGGRAKRETDTMDTFVCSSWYFFRYLDPQNDEVFADKKKLESWMPVDMYIGGAEHTVLHLLYSRFFTKVLYDAGYIKVTEPFKRLFHQGTILGPDNQKMSKSKGNVVNPDDLVKKYGADTVRMFLMFMGPYDQGGPLQTTGVNGIHKLLERIRALYDKKSEKDVMDDIETQKIISKMIMNIGKDLKELKFNTALSQIMITTNFLQKKETIGRDILEKFTQVIAPFAPFLAEELWENMGYKESVHLQKWPVFDTALTQEEFVAIAVQVNGKVRGQVISNIEASESDIMELAKKEENIEKYLQNKKILRNIYIPGKILSIVTD